MEKITIGTVTFELQKRPVENVHRISNRTLYDCYGKPSDKKEAIWNDWHNYFTETLHTYDFGIASYSCNFFTIEAMFVHEGVRYYARITPSHNYLYKRIYT